MHLVHNIKVCHISLILLKYLFILNSLIVKVCTRCCARLVLTYLLEIEGRFIMIIIYIFVSVSLDLSILFISFHSQEPHKVYLQVDAFPGDIVIFSRVLNLLRGL